jgi:dTDP-4-amino-4,6-dideoxy-D-galactose acyltransferase
VNGTKIASEPQVVRLDWECEHFGFSTGLLHGHGLDDRALWLALESARDAHFELVVVTMEPDRVIDAALPCEFCGTLTDRKATFSHTLAAIAPAHGRQENSPCHIAEYSARATSPQLLNLAMASGAYSRFNVDPRFPRARFLEMYRIWIERSVRREIADTVLVEHDPMIEDGLSGMVTVAIANGIGKIGLLAVAEQARGRGVGRRLLNSAHEWMRSHGAHDARVVTQLANSPACGLYRACGYALAAVEDYYHFWPLATG